MIELAGAQPRDDDRVAELLLAGGPEGSPTGLRSPSCSHPD
jgi:hypothetical protein